VNVFEAMQFLVIMSVDHFGTMQKAAKSKEDLAKLDTDKKAVSASLLPFSLLRADPAINKSEIKKSASFSLSSQKLETQKNLRTL
jgi:hypothetical protein